MSILLMALSSYSWSKENNVDDYHGVNTMTSSVSLLAAVVLVVVSEVMLFISILWSVVLSLVAHSIYTPRQLVALMHYMHHSTSLWTSTTSYG